jgi:alkanesulfonate monooxygenase SsuD/methylene tetrahydromethanopterin reductase-like flavin-dependent oxidoreductase (luciferase family)
MPNVAEGAAKSGRSVSEIAVIVPVMTIVGDSDEDRQPHSILARRDVAHEFLDGPYEFIRIPGSAEL